MFAHCAKLRTQDHKSLYLLVFIVFFARLSFFQDWKSLRRKSRSRRKLKNVHWFSRKKTTWGVSEKFASNYRWFVLVSFACLQNVWNNSPSWIFQRSLINHSNRSLSESVFFYPGCLTDVKDLCFHFPAKKV